MTQIRTEIELKEQAKELFSDKKGFEEIVDKLINELKTTSIHAYRQSFLRANPGSVWNAIAELSFLLQINAVYFAMDGSLHPTSAGLLMFGREEALARVFPGLELSNHLEK